MRDVDGSLLFSASDLTRFMGCNHATVLDLQHLRGVGPKPAAATEDAELLQKQGDAHEAAHLQALRAGGKRVMEIKVNESFDKLVSEWLVGASEGKIQRLDYLCTLLGLEKSSVGQLRYQLLHRTASAIIEARRFKTDRAAMVVHSFSPTRLWFDDFARFVEVMGGSARPDTPCTVKLRDGLSLTLGWASGDERFLKA